MLKTLRQNFIQHLWHDYRARIPHIPLLETELKKMNIKQIILDHFALIDLPSEQSGIPVMSRIFKTLGFSLRGTGYLPDKQNDFAWLSENECLIQAAIDVLPQVVVADFRLDEMPEAIRKIIIKYTKFTNDPSLALNKLIDQMQLNKDENTAQTVMQILKSYFSGRDWPLPSVYEFRRVQEFNELLAWVLIFGRRPNHFTYSIHLMKNFHDLAHFNTFIETLGLNINNEGGKIKGGKQAGIAQSGTAPIAKKIKLSDGEVELPTEFIEFVWRYPLKDGAALWGDYFTDFIATQANHVIKSLYQPATTPECPHSHPVPSDCPSPQ